MPSETLMPRTAFPDRKVDLRGPLAGLASLIFLALIFPAFDFASAVKAAPPDQHWAAGTAVVHEWQTLLGSIFTPLAAVFGGWVVLRQIQDAKAQETARLRRRRRAQRAAMPSMMSRICDYAESSAACLREALAVAESEGVIVGTRFATSYPQVDEATFDRIVGMVEAAATESEAAAYQELLQELQIHSSRWRGFTGASGIAPERYSPKQIFEEIVEAAELYARASNLLIQARSPDRSPGQPMTRYNGVHHLGMRDEGNPALQLAAAYDERSPLSYPGTD